MARAMADLSGLHGRFNKSEERCFILGELCAERAHFAHQQIMLVKIACFCFIVRSQHVGKILLMLTESMRQRVDYFAPVVEQEILEMVDLLLIVDGGESRRILVQ